MVKGAYASLLYVSQALLMAWMPPLTLRRSFGRISRPKALNPPVAVSQPRTTPDSRPQDPNETTAE